MATPSTPDVSTSSPRGSRACGGAKRAARFARGSRKLPFDDINNVSRIDYDKRTGCALRVAKCPGPACFVIDLTFAEDKALIKMPYEMPPVPGAGDEVDCLNRTGDVVGRGKGGECDGTAQRQDQNCVGIV